MRIGFDSDRYVETQAEHIRERIGQFGGKLYLEFGGKIFDDHHASRVLPGYVPDNKVRMLRQLSDEVEIVIVVNANDIESGKRRSDIGITYAEDARRLMDIFKSLGLYVGSVCLTRFAGQPAAVHFQKMLEDAGVRVWRHYSIDGYPANVEKILSEDGFGKNDYIQTTKPLVVVCAPGPGSGKLATCLSQLYNEHVHGVQAGYAKFETFPVWNLDLNHPVNIAYEAATADLDDRNIIDPFHLGAYDKVTVNYNRDVESFPVLKAMLDGIMGESPYQSPTDMGVNMVGFCITDDEVCREAGKREIVRRYFNQAERVRLTGNGKEALAKLEIIMSKAGVDMDLSPARAAALEKEERTGRPAAAMELPDGTLIVGKTSEVMGAASTLLLKSLKHLAGVDQEKYIVGDEALQPINRLKTELMHSRNPRLHSDEMLIALSISSATNPLAKQAIDAAEGLRGCDAYFSVIISEADRRVMRALGINVCCEPKYEREGFYHK